MRGFFMWMPRGNLYYNGTTSYAGTAWVCAFLPNNSNKSRFLGSSQAQIGGTVPIGIFKYRAVATPFCVALPKNQCVVSQMQSVIGQLVHMCPTSSGITKNVGCL